MHTCMLKVATGNLEPKYVNPWLALILMLQTIFHRHINAICPAKTILARVFTTTCQVYQGLPHCIFPSACLFHEILFHLRITNGLRCSFANLMVP